MIIMKVMKVGNRFELPLSLNMIRSSLLSIFSKVKIILNYKIYKKYRHLLNIFTLCIDMLT